MDDNLKLNEDMGITGKETKNQEPVAPTVDKKEEVEMLLQKVRADEKAKLYPQIAKVKSELSAKNELVESLNNKIKELEVKMSSIDTLANQVVNPNNTEMGKEYAESTIVELKSKIAHLETISKENAELSKKLTELQENVECYKLGILLEETRKNLVGDLEEEFQDLLTGNSVEELQTSYTKLKDKQTKIITKYRPSNPLPKPTGDMLKEIVGGGKDIKSMSNEEYAKVRQALGFGK